MTSLYKDAKNRNLENFRQIVARPDEREISFRETSEKGNIILEEKNFFLFFSFVWRINLRGNRIFSGRTKVNKAGVGVRLKFNLTILKYFHFRCETLEYLARGDQRGLFQPNY